MFSHVPTAGRFEQSPAITIGVPGATLENDELWIELEESELFDELDKLKELLDKLEELDRLIDEDDITTEDELFEDELINEVDELTREDEFITDEPELGIKLELVAVEVELEEAVDKPTVELTLACTEEPELPDLSEAPHPIASKENKAGNKIPGFILFSVLNQHLLSFQTPQTTRKIR